jgi:hypothetical protein
MNLNLPNYGYVAKGTNSDETIYLSVVENCQFSRCWIYVYDVRKHENVNVVYNTRFRPNFLNERDSICTQGSTKNLIMNECRQTNEMYYSNDFQLKLSVYNRNEKLYDICDPTYYKDITQFELNTYWDTTRVSDRRGYIYEHGRRMFVYNEKGIRVHQCNPHTSSCRLCFFTHMCADQNLYTGFSRYVYTLNQFRVVHRFVQPEVINKSCVCGVKLALLSTHHIDLYDTRMYKRYLRVDLPIDLPLIKYANFIDIDHFAYVVSNNLQIIKI